MSADLFNAFKSNNYPYLAKIGLSIHFHDEALWRQKPELPLRLHTGMDRNVMFIHLFPGITRQTIDYLLDTPGIKGIVLKTYGAGNAQTEPWFIEKISEAIARGIVIVNVSQCINGAIQDRRHAVFDRCGQRARHHNRSRRHQTDAPFRCRTKPGRSGNPDATVAPRRNDRLNLLQA